MEYILCKSHITEEEYIIMNQNNESVMIQAEQTWW